MNQNICKRPVQGTFYRGPEGHVWNLDSAKGVNLTDSFKRCILLTLDAWSRILFMGDPQSSVYHFCLHIC